MGQGWSDGSLPDGQLPSHVTRYRSDSEPPTSWGGHAVTRIPENEEVNNQTSDIQYADWKKSSLASGILREKPCLVPPGPPPPAPPPAPATPSSPKSDTLGHQHKKQQVPAQLSQAQPKLSRSMSVDYAHLADFSMFPDKFSMHAPTPPAGPATTPKSGINSLQLPVVRSRHNSFSSSQGTPDDKQPVGATPPTTPLSSMANSFFRTRASSASEPMERHSNESSSATMKDTAKDEVVVESDKVGESLQVPAQIRPRSSSYSGRFPFFDFSMIPDKDPHFTNGDHQQAVAKGQRPPRVRRTSSTSSNGSHSSDHVAQANVVNVVVPDGSSVVAAALTMAATTPDRPEQPPPPPAQPKSNKAHNAPRFTFFDYSLIPDKDPRAFVRNRDGKNN